MTTPSSHRSTTATETLRTLRRRQTAEVHLGPFSAAEYKTLMMRYDILALPYDPQVYGNKPSGIFAEAVGLEKIVVVPASIRMAKIVQRHDIGVVYEDYSAAGLAADFDEAISHL